MIDFSQGDIIKIAGYKNCFLVISKNSYIKATQTFHVCPILSGIPEGPLHIAICGRLKEKGIAVCEQLKLIDPFVRACVKEDTLPYSMIMDISDAVQGIFEYD